MPVFLTWVFVILLHGGGVARGSGRRLSEDSWVVESSSTSWASRLWPGLSSGKTKGLTGMWPGPVLGLSRIAQHIWLPSVLLVMSGWEPSVLHSFAFCLLNWVCTKLLALYLVNMNVHIQLLLGRMVCSCKKKSWGHFIDVFLSTSPLYGGPSFLFSIRMSRLSSAPFISDLWRLR